MSGAAPRMFGTDLAGLGPIRVESEAGTGAVVDSKKTIKCLYRIMYSSYCDYIIALNAL